MRNLARDVMEHMRLRNSVRSMGTDPAHDGSTVAKKRAIKSRKSSTGKGELGSAVVRQERVGMLQERDQNEPMVHPKKVRMNSMLVLL